MMNSMIEKNELRVVIADNNLQDRESKQKTMTDMGMKVVLATGNGSKALEAIRSEKPDVVVMDMILPGIDGIGILEEIHQENILERKPIFVIQTALRMENLVDEAIQAGADYYMMKPVSNTMLMKRIVQLLAHCGGSKPANSGMPPAKLPPAIEGEAAGQEELAEQEKAATGEESLFSGDLERDVTNILLEIGIPAHIKGYQYIREGIIMSFYDRNMLHYITKYLYPSIAKKYKTTSTSVERTIRHAIEVAWRRGNIEVLEEVFGNTVNAEKGKPTNSEFMALLTDRLRLEYRNRTAS